MSLPYFYASSISLNDSVYDLDEEAARHSVQVLRMKPGDQMNLTDGKGHLFTSKIIHANKGSTQVEILSSASIPAPSQLVVAISLIKNANRFEWFLEKACEIGVTQVVPVICERTEKQHFRAERLTHILVSAMLQSRQAWLPKLHPLMSFSNCIEEFDSAFKFIAHCRDDKKQPLRDQETKGADVLILIGPEGDFTQREVEAAIQNDFISVSLGETRLRTETAGVVAAALLKN